MSISLVLPTYNEKENIINLIKLSSDEFNKYKVDFEIIVVDDNSPDGTSKIVSDFIKKSKAKNIRLITRKEKGLATAIRKGFDSAETSHVMVIDTDLSHHPRYFRLLFEQYDKYDIVSASRFLKFKNSDSGMKAPGHRVLGSKIMNKVYRLFTRIPITDFTGGFFIMNKSKLDKLDKEFIFHGYGDYFLRLLFLAYDNNYTIKEVPFTYEFRKLGKTKTSFIKEGIRYLREVKKLKDYARKKQITFSN